MSQPRVTVTVGQDGQRSAKISLGRSYSEDSGGSVAGRKRSLKYRLGASSGNVPPNVHQVSNKRQHLESGWKQRVYKEVEDDVTMSTILSNGQNTREDLRHKLEQKHSYKVKQIHSSREIMGNNLQERISAPLAPSHGQRRIIVRRHPLLPPKAVPFLGPLTPSTSIASRVKDVPKVSVAVEQPTVTSLLQSLGLGKYYITFQAEEIDMTALRNMNDDDLKELGLPMGPRKKILIALSSRRCSSPDHL